jgi:5-methylcytosine-specific restriction endonuclease McrA
VVELAFGLFFIVLGLILVYNLVMAVYYLVRGVLEFVWSVLTWPFRVVGDLFGGRPRRPTPTSPPVRWADVFGSPRAEPESRYTRDWATVSRKYKDSRGWRCEGCGVYCGGSKGDRRLLHVHHRDLNPQNNARSNLDALCVVCHSERAGAGHRRLAGAISSDGRRWSVERLRRAQGR